MKAALIGTGLMGGPMVERLLESGHEVTVFNRTRSKALALEEAGAVVAEDLHQAIAGSELTLLMLSDASAIRETLEPHGRFPDLAERTLCQMGTIAPRESIALLEDIRRAGGQYFEAPVLGSRPQARDGKLLVMVGSTVEQFERWRDLLSCLGETPQRIGEVGQAAALKLAFNQLIGIQLAGFATALGIIHRHRIGTQVFMDFLRQSALYAPMFDSKLPRIEAREFDDPNFPTQLLLKDLELARGLAAELDLNTDVLAGLCSVARLAVEKGLGDADYSAVAEVVAPRES